MKALALPIVAVFVLGCSAHSFALEGERTLEAASDAWSEHVTEAVEECRSQQLETEAERAACIEPVRKVDEDIVAPLVVAAVAALRAYWLGVSVGESPAELAKHMADFSEAVSGLPVEYFGGLRGGR